MRRSDAVGLRRLALAGLAGGLITLTLAAPNAVGQFGSIDGPDESIPKSVSSTPRAAYLAARPGAFISNDEGVRRLAGAPLAFGNNPREAADTAVAEAAALFGADPADLIPGAEHLPAGQDSVQMVYNPVTGQYKFTAVYYQQVRDGIPVFDSRVTVVVRNEANFPVVLMNPDVRDLGNFSVDEQAGGNRNAGIGAIHQDAADEVAGPGSQIFSTRRVIFAGTTTAPAAPALADEMVVVNGFDKWRVVADANTGDVLYEEFMICFGTVSGNVSGNASDGPGTADCEPEVAKPVPYAQVNTSGSPVFTDANGDFSTTDTGGSLTMLLKGQWFDVINVAGSDYQISVPASTPANGLFGASGATEQQQSQINAYIESNVVRDFVLQYNPSYPTLSNANFPVYVNRTDGFCPQNAWYDPTEESINFCLSGGGAPNTAWTSVIYHEYGHHLVNAAGSGQGQYGEGMGDVMSTLILDDNRLGLGFFGSCSESLRDADNTLQYPCSDSSHFCGQLISGCVWDIRNELVASGVPNYIDVLSNMAVNAMLVHSGSSITPQIAIDYLTLDDDNANLDDGTPHYAEVVEGFRVHNMLPPDISTVTISLPNGVPTFANPDGTTTMQVKALAFDGTIVAGSTTMWVDNGGGFSPIVMTPIGGDLYEADFPATTCGQLIDFYFSAESTSGETAQSPATAPTTHYSVASAYSEGTISFEDDFETNNGWTVSTSASDGGWERGIPVDFNRGDPPADADGSSRCYLTDNTTSTSNSDVDNGATTLTSPVMDASGGGYTISYWRWFSNDSGDGPNSDPFTVEINDGSGWQILEVVGPSGPGTSGGWFQVQFNLDDVPGFTQNNQFQIRFTAEDTNPQSIVEAAVDGVELIQIDCDVPEPICPADIVENGQVDLFDLLDLIDNWGTDAPGADLAAPNDVIDLLDLLELIDQWGACE